MAAISPIIAGLLVAAFGGFGTAATIFAVIYVITLPALLFLPETTGKPLPK